MFDPVRGFYINSAPESNHLLVFILLTRSNTNYSNWSTHLLGLALELVVNQELCNLSIWLTANKLTLNIKKNKFCYFLYQRYIQSASLHPGTQSFFLWTQRILIEGSNSTQKKNRMFMQITSSRKKQRHTIHKFVFRENNFYQLIDSSVTVYFAVNFQAKAEKPLRFLITFLSR